ncbi:T9SS type A sorting domain-containing protein [Flavobacterium phycosphaerae]|uniref:T9SS type A sorting domain-containing protein n=1 Tax=Flavobacterium phycosphaerae TaxID=2697515 RepID=UPI00138994E0|nr:T9SS type A sorting domain-containing protein [Flavobacterium phycosphaerae]
MIKNYLSLFLLVFGFFSTISFGQVNANDDIFAVVYGASQVTAGNCLLNDTVNASQAQASNVIISMVSSTNPGISLSGSNVIVAGGTPQGTYSLTYKICDAANASVCDTGIVTINTKILANPDSFFAPVCGFFVGNVLGSGPDLNYIDTLNGEPAVLVSYYSQPDNVYHPATVTLNYNAIYPEILIQSNGDIFVMNPSFTGSYVLTYEICEIAHPTNCSTGYVNLTLFYPPPYAIDDYFMEIDNATGGITPSVLDNDFSPCSGGNLNTSNSYITPYTVSPGVTLNFDGTITVDSGTAPGSYYVPYTVCEFNNSCAQAAAYFAVVGVSNLVANYDSYTNYPNTTTASVLNNDTLNGNPITDSSSVLISPLSTPPTGFTLNSNGSITIASTVIEGTYVLPYKICSISNTNDCYVNYAYIVVFKNRITGKVKFDANSNGCDPGDAYLNNIKVKNVNGSSTYTSYTNYDGASNYYLIADVGNNTVSVTDLPSYFTVTPPTQTINFATAGVVASFGDFCVSINSNVNDLEVVLIPLFNVVPGLPVFYNIWYKNNGSTTLSGQVTFQFDNSKMSFLSSSPSPTNLATNTLTYTFSNLTPFESRLVKNVKFQVATPPTVDSGDIAAFSASVTPTVADATPTNNTNSTSQTVVNSQDPNDIAVHEGSTITLAQAQQDYLHYTIRFQNIGDSDAINIRVLNDLDAKLDWSTFQLVSTSHNCRVKNKNGHNEFLFEGINLPGNLNEPESHGYISYKVKPISSIALGNVISNTANIYFDYNAPIQTNTVSTTVVALGNDDFAFTNFNYYPNPVKNTLMLSNATTIDEIEISSVLGQKILSKKVNELQTELNISELSNGIYFVKITSGGQEKTVKIIKK